MTKNETHEPVRRHDDVVSLLCDIVVGVLLVGNRVTHSRSRDVARVLVLLTAHIGFVHVHVG